MTIKKIKDLLPSSDHPVENIIQDNHCIKVSLIGFQNGMMLREKKVENPTKLIVLNGTLKYFEVDKKVVLTQYDEYEIPADVTHYIVADEKSLCLMSQDRLFQDN